MRITARRPSRGIDLPEPHTHKLDPMQRHARLDLRGATERLPNLNDSVKEREDRGSVVVFRGITMEARQLQITLLVSRCHYEALSARKWQQKPTDQWGL